MRITKSLSVFGFLLFASVQIFAQCKTENCGLVIRGKVIDLKVDRSDKNYVKFFATIDAEFVNNGTENIILFKPEFEDGYWLGGRSLSVTETGESIFGYGLWQSVSGAERCGFISKISREIRCKNAAKGFDSNSKAK
jgi:hypothetical protein